MKEGGTSKSIEKFLTRRRCDFYYIVRISVDDPAILQRRPRFHERTLEISPNGFWRAFNDAYVLYKYYYIFFNRRKILFHRM